MIVFLDLVNTQRYSVQTCMHSYNHLAVAMNLVVTIVVVQVIAVV